MPDQLPAPYVSPMKIRARSTRKQPRGLSVINMSFNELPYAPSKNVMAAIHQASTDANRYGNPDCEALRIRLARTFKLDADCIICGNGSEELLDVLGRLFARSGDEILIPEFGYVQFPIVANRVGARLVKAAETDFTANVENLLSAITDRTRMVFVANPNNPTGTMINEKDIARLASSVPKHVVLVLDLAYAEFAGEDYCAAIHKLVFKHDNVVVTRTFSKAYGLAGLRIGWCHAPSWMMPELYATRGMGTANAVAQAAAIASLQEPELLQSRINTIVFERSRVAEELSAMGFHVLPSDANFLLVKPGNGDASTADSLATHLFDDAGILVNQTREAGLEKFIRFSLSLPEHNTVLLSSVRSFIS